MATDAAKTGTDQQSQPPPLAPYPPPFAAHYAPMPPGAYPPPFYTFAPLPDPSHDPNSPNGAAQPQQYFMAIPPPPPGMMYAYPAPGQMLPYPPFAPPPMQVSPQPRPKRKQVKMACTNCANACKRCDDSRPCERCTKYGLTDTCVDGQRKERKKGIKRGPYKRKPKSPSDDNSFPANGAAGEGEASTAPPAPYPAPHEAYYPYYYPHPAFAPPGHETQAHGEGVANGTTHPVPQPYFPLHPAVYPPYPQYAHPPPMAYAAPPALMAPPPATAEASKSPSANGADKSKKRPRTSKGSDGPASKSRKTDAGTTNGATNDGERSGREDEGYQDDNPDTSYELPASGSDIHGTDSGHMESPV